MTSINASDRAAGFPLSGWTRAARCGPDGGNCVEVNFSVAGLVAIRSSKQPCSPLLLINAHEWRCFLTAACAGQLVS